MVAFLAADPALSPQLADLLHHLRVLRGKAPPERRHLADGRATPAPDQFVQMASAGASPPGARRPAATSADALDGIFSCASLFLLALLLLAFATGGFVQYVHDAPRRIDPALAVPVNFVQYLDQSQ